MLRDKFELKKISLETRIFKLNFIGLKLHKSKPILS